MSNAPGARLERPEPPPPAVALPSNRAQQYAIAVGLYDPGQAHMAHCGVGLPKHLDMRKLQILCMRNEPLQFSAENKKNIVVRRTQAVNQFMLGDTWFYDYTHIGVEQQVMAKRPPAAADTKLKKVLEAKNLKCTQIASSMLSLAENRNSMLHPETKRGCTKPVVFNDSPQRKFRFTFGKTPKAMGLSYYKEKMTGKNFARSFFDQTRPINDHWERKWKQLDKGRQADVSDCLWAAVTYISAHVQEQHNKEFKADRKRQRQQNSSNNKKKAPPPPPPAKRKKTEEKRPAPPVKKIDLTLDEEEEEDEIDESDESLAPPPLSSYPDHWLRAMSISSTTISSGED